MVHNLFIISLLFCKSIEQIRTCMIAATAASRKCIVDCKQSTRLRLEMRREEFDERFLIYRHCSIECRGRVETGLFFSASQVTQAINGGEMNSELLLHAKQQRLEGHIGFPQEATKQPLFADSTKNIFIPF